jgi:hypothetical protein
MRHVYRGVIAMKFAVFASLAILLGAGSAFAADTDAATVGRPNAVLNEVSCLAVWHRATGEEQTRFHRAQASLVPVNAKGIVTNFQQADADGDGKVSQVEFLKACKLGLVAGDAVDVNIVADDY